MDSLYRSIFLAMLERKINYLYRSFWIDIGIIPISRDKKQHASILKTKEQSTFRRNPHAKQKDLEPYLEKKHRSNY